MSSRIRLASARSRMLGATFEAHQPPDECVVPPVGGVAGRCREKQIEPMLGIPQDCSRDGDAGRAQPIGANRDEEGLGRLATSVEILDALPNQLCPGQRAAHHHEAILRLGSSSMLPPATISYGVPVDHAPQTAHWLVGMPWTVRGGRAVMRELTDLELLYGRNDPPPEPLRL